MRFNFKFIALLILSCSTHFLSAQYEDLQKDKNITWIAEFSNDHNFSLNTSSKEGKIKLIKFTGDASSFSDHNTSSWVTSWIFNKAQEGKYQCFNDSELTQSLYENELIALISNKDTVVTFNPDTYEEMIQIVKTDLSPKDIHGLRVKQVIYYHQKSKSLNTRVVAVAPLVLSKAARELGIKPKKDQLLPLFWIKMDGKLPKKFKKKSSDINWAALVFSKTNPIDLDAIKTVKISNGFDIKNQIYQQAVNFEKPIVSSYDGKEKIKPTELKAIFTRRDTVVSISPQTYQEEVKINETKITSKEISNIRLVQEWYFDGKRNQLMNRVKAINPIIKRTVKGRKYKIWKPLFMIKYD